MRHPQRGGGEVGGGRERERADLGIFHNGGSRASPWAMTFEMLLQGAHKEIIIYIGTYLERIRKLLFT
jgi:hypothetical protein